MTATIPSAFADASTPAERATSTTTILVADDSRTVSRLIARTLRNAEYRVVIADDGLQAVEQAFKHAPDLVVLDISMPGLNGLGVCQTLLSDRRWDPSTPIVFLTGTDKPHLAALGDRMGAFLTKPAEPGKVLATIQALLIGRPLTGLPRRNPTVSHTETESTRTVPETLTSQAGSEGS